jgi:hypothetical protein
MEKATRIYTTIGVLAIVVIAGYFIFNKATVDPTKYADFAKCLSEKGAKMYGSDTCTHCASQKKEFGASWQYVTYFECDPNGVGANVSACEAAKLNGYPTWIFADGTRIEGETSLAQLGQKTGCTLPA